MEEYELAGDVPAENMEEDGEVCAPIGDPDTIEKFDPEDFPPLAGLLAPEDLEPVTVDPNEDDAP